MDACMANPDATAQLSQTLHDATLSNPQQGQGWGFARLSGPFAAIAKFGMQVMFGDLELPEDASSQETGTSDYTSCQDTPLSPRHWRNESSSASSSPCDAFQGVPGWHDASPKAVLTSVDQRLTSSPAQECLGPTPDNRVSQVQMSQMGSKANIPSKGMSPSCQVAKP